MLCISKADWKPAPRARAEWAPSADPNEKDRQRDAWLAQIEKVLAAWRSWNGNFSAFCRHVRRDLRIDDLPQRQDLSVSAPRQMTRMGPRGRVA